MRQAVSGGAALRPRPLRQTTRLPALSRLSGRDHRTAAENSTQHSWQASPLMASFVPKSARGKAKKKHTAKKADRPGNVGAFVIRCDHKDVLGLAMRRRLRDGSQSDAILRIDRECPQSGSYLDFVVRVSGPPPGDDAHALPAQALADWLAQ